jgi:hypothetical protein
MNDETTPAPKRRLNAYGRLVRRGRIFTRLREGWAYDEIARAEGLSAERIRQIVSEVLEKRPVDSVTDHSKLQLARLAPAMQLAGEAIIGGDVTAIAPLLKVLDRLDRYQKTAIANHVYDEDARQKLLDKINRIADRLRDEKAAKTGEAEDNAEDVSGGQSAGAGAGDGNFASGFGVSP